MGVSAHVIDAFLELYAGIASGHVQAEFPRSAETTTPTSFEQFAREVMRPAIA